VSLWRKSDSETRGRASCDDGRPWRGKDEMYLGGVEVLYRKWLFVILWQVSASVWQTQLLDQYSSQCYVGMDN
jgi:hypothetical protein